jgi:hypothetical protein
MRIPSVSACTAFVAVACAAAFLASSCEGEGGGATGAGDVAPQLRTRTGTVTLGLEEGLVFSTGEVLTGAVASTLTVDLIAFAHSGGLKLEPGSPRGAMRVVLRAGGRPLEYASLGEVPSEAPDAALHDLLIKPAPGHGATVLGNVTDGHARIRVVELPFGATPRVTVEFEAWWYE